MKRLPVLLIVMALILTACAGNKAGNWGPLTATLTPKQADAQGWTADLVVKNTSAKTVPYQYQPPAEYTLIISKDGKEIYRRASNPLSQPSTQNLAPNTEKSHLVLWRYVDQEGKKVAPGTYEARVELNAVTVNVQGAPKVPAVKVEVK